MDCLYRVSKSLRTIRFHYHVKNISIGTSEKWRNGNIISPGRLQHSSRTGGLYVLLLFLLMTQGKAQNTGCLSDCPSVFFVP